MRNFLELPQQKPHGKRDYWELTAFLTKLTCDLNQTRQHLILPKFLWFKKSNASKNIYAASD